MSLTKLLSVQMQFMRPIIWHDRHGVGLGKANRNQLVLMNALRLCPVSTHHNGKRPNADYCSYVFKIFLKNLSVPECDL